MSIFNLVNGYQYALSLVVFKKFNKFRILLLSLSIKSPPNSNLFFHTIATEFYNTNSHPKKRPHRYFLLYNIK